MSDSSPEAADTASLRSTIGQALRGAHLDYTSMPLGRSILVLAVPMVLETSMQSLFAVCDIYFVSKLGPNAVAGVGITEALLSIIFAIGLGVAMGTTATVARRIGEKNREGASRVAAQALVLGVVISLLMGIPGAIFAEDLLALMGADAAVQEAGRGYTAFMMGGSGTILLLFIINAAFRGAGDAMLALKALALANFANIILDPILIFGLGPIPAMGVTGAAIATNLGRALGVSYQLHQLFRGNGRIRITWRDMGFDGAVVSRLLDVSSKAMMQYFVITTSFTGMIRVIAPYSADALAGYTIAVRVIVFVLLPAWGLSNAAATLVGQNLGAQQPERAERAVWFTAHCNAVFLGSVAVIFFILAPQLMRLFTDVDAVIAIGAQCLRTVSCGYLFMAYAMIMVAAFNGSGDTTTPTWVNFWCHWCLKIPLAYVLTWPLGWGPFGVFLAIPTAETAVAISMTLLFRRGGWKHREI